MTRNKKNRWAELLLSVVVPTVILTRFSSEAALGPTWGLVIALAFPIAYGAWEIASRRGLGIFPVIGLINILLTGGFALFALPAEYLIWKEAGVPAFLGLLVLISEFTRFPLAEKLFEETLAMETIASAYRKQQHADPRKRLRTAGFLIAGTFFFSAVLNYVVASQILTGTPGTSEFTEQIGRLTGVSYLVIGLPVTIVFIAVLGYLIRSLMKDTGLPLEKLVRVD